MVNVVRVQTPPPPLLKNNLCPRFFSEEGGRGGGRPYTGYDIKKKGLETSIRTLTRMRNMHIVTFQEGVLNMRWKTRLADIYDLISIKRVWKTSHF